MSGVPLLPEFDYRTDSGLLDDPWIRWDELQQEHRVFRAEFGPDPIWVLTRMEDIREAMQDPELFSSSMAMVIHEVGAHRWIPTELDPPELGKRASG
jgi:cytochrome P450